MEQDYSKYSDEMLIKEWEEGYDLDESVFFVLGELERRKHPKTKAFSLEVLNRDLGFDEYFVSSAMNSLYSYDEEYAILYAKEHYKDFHIHSLGSLLSLLWVDSEQKKSQNKRELIKLIKEYLKSLKKQEISDIQKDYDEFMKAYKDI